MKEAKDRGKMVKMVRDKLYKKNTVPLMYNKAKVVKPWTLEVL
jgi:hypothetical protein